MNGWIYVDDSNLSSKMNPHEKHCSKTPLYIETPVLSFPVDIFRQTTALGQYCLAPENRRISILAFFPHFLRSILFDKRLNST